MLHRPVNIDPATGIATVATDEAVPASTTRPQAQATPAPTPAGGRGSALPTPTPARRGTEPSPGRRPAR